MQKTYLVGLNVPVKAKIHESGVCLIDEQGTVLFAVNEERLSRVKFDGGFPVRSVEEMFRYTGIKPEEVTYVCLPVLAPFPKALRYLNHLVHTRIGEFLRPRTYLNMLGLLRQEIKPTVSLQGLSGVSNASFTDHRAFIAKYFPNAKITYCDHHVAHVASAYFTSPWEEALAITLDGSGSLRSSIVAEARHGALKVIDYTFHPHSLGGFWGAITKACGFSSGYRHGGKTTGLAAYGNPAILRDAMQRAVWEEGGRVHRNQSVRFASNPSCPDWEYPGVNKETRENIAAAAQERLEEVASAIISKACKRTGLSKVVAAGGVFANVLMNQKLLALPEVDDLYIVPAMSDGGLALGAALYTLSRLYRKEGSALHPQRMGAPYFGPSYSPKEVEAALARAGVKARRMEQPASEVARLVHGRKVVALYQGRMEWGPRALGNRSIIYAPVEPEVNRWLNDKLRRSEFMPFAPVTLAPYAHQCYENMSKDPVAARFMTITYDCSEEMKRQAPACVHIDGTARPQVLRREDNPYYYDIIDEYRKLSGIPTLINTSYNMHEEPIVCTPDDALKAFLDSEIDYLVLEDYLVSLEENKERLAQYRGQPAVNMPDFSHADTDPTL